MRRHHSDATSPRRSGSAAVATRRGGSREALAPGPLESLSTTHADVSQSDQLTEQRKPRTPRVKPNPRRVRRTNKSSSPHLPATNRLHDGPNLRAMRYRPLDSLPHPPCGTQAPQRPARRRRAAERRARRGERAAVTGGRAEILSACHVLRDDASGQTPQELSETVFVSSSSVSSSTDYPRRSRGVAATRPPQTIAAAASPRLVSTEYPRRGRGVAATRLR